jgi:hypothetical protein
MKRLQWSANHNGAGAGAQSTWKELAGRHNNKLEQEQRNGEGENGTTCSRRSVESIFYLHEGMRASTQELGTTGVPASTAHMSNERTGEYSTHKQQAYRLVQQQWNTGVGEHSNNSRA